MFPKCLVSPRTSSRRGDRALPAANALAPACGTPGRSTLDLAVAAGGQGSVQTAVASGLPFIGIPLQPEQEANVAFVERQGAARLVALQDVGTPVLAGIARELLATSR